MRSEDPRVSEIRDQWATGSTYEDFMGRWSRLLAPRFVAWMQIPAHVHWLEIGCGTGAMTEAICRSADPASVVACDPAAPLIEYARGHFQDARASFVKAGAGSLPHRDGGYGGVTSLLALNFLPDVQAALQEMRALSASGGTVSACVWDYAGRMEFLRVFWDAAAALDPAARALDEGVRFPLCHPAALEILFRSVGLRDVRCESLDIPTRFTDFDDYWRPLLGGTGPAPSYVASLGVEQRAALASRIDTALPREPGGTMVLTARAWAVCGTVP